MRWVAGNDVLLKVHVMEKVLEGNTVVEQDFDLTACESISVVVSNGYKQTAMEHALDAEERNCMAVRLPYTLSVGTYTMEVKMVKNGSHVRSFDFAFQVVATDCEASTTFTKVDGCRSASLRVTVQMVPQAMVRGKSAYELWTEQPGNEDKTLDEFLEWYVGRGGMQPATHETDGLMTAEDKRLIDALREMTDITDEEIVSWFYGPHTDDGQDENS